MTLQTFTDFLGNFLNCVFVGLGLVGFIKTIFLDKQVDFLLNNQKDILAIIKGMVRLHDLAADNEQKILKALKKITNTPNEEKKEQ